MWTAEVINGYSIRIIDDIHAPDLVRHWKRIAEETDCFPQMYYEWCEPWWRLQSGNRKLHLVAVEDAGRKIVGIAPLCIEKRFGLRVLRSFPIHFGDYYSFLIEEGDRLDAILDAIIAYMNTYAGWHILHLANVNSKSQSYGPLRDAGFAPSKLSDIYTADFTDMTFEDFLKRLSKNRRYKYRYPLKRLQKKGRVTLECVEDASAYMAYVGEMQRLYNARWANDHSLPPDDVYCECRYEAMSACFDKRKAALFVLRCEENIIAFRLGFMHKGVFHEWKITHDPSFDSFSPGTVSLGKVIETLVSLHYRQIDFMPGEHAYKRWWSPDGVNSVNYDLFASGSPLRSRLYLGYRLKWRGKLRKIYYGLLEIRLVQVVKRWLEAHRRRLKS